MTLAGDTGAAPVVARRSWIGALLKFVAGVLACMTPVTAVIVLGWLTRKTERDISARLDGRSSAGWPNFLVAEDRSGGNWIARSAGSLWLNAVSGLKAWAAIALLTLPFALVWLAGWFAGWENSFSKGYEQSWVWPSFSLLAVLVSVPVFMLVPMAIGHQAVDGRVRAIVELRTITRLVRRAGFGYLGLTVLFAVGAIGVFGSRALPAFAESFSAAMQSGDAQAIEQFAGGMRLLLSALLFVGLVVLRRVLSRVYARAILKERNAVGEPGWLVSGVVLGSCAVIWLGTVFLIYAAQFLNYSPWAWLNQPTFMLPWIGTF